MPLHFKRASHEKIPLSIPRKEINLFLCELWEDFNKTIGPVSCQHSYMSTENTEVYEYNICWAHHELPFIAELSFFNHTAKGLIYVLLETLDFDTRLHDSASHKKIKDSLLRSVKNKIKKIPSTPSGYISIPIQSRVNLSGNYFFEQAELLLLTKDRDGFDILFPVFTSEPLEIQFEASAKSINLVSSLSLITQNTLIINDNLKWDLIAPNTYQKLLESSEFNGKFLSDDGLIFQSANKQERKEIIETEDCVIDERLRIPERTDMLLSILDDNDRLQQASRRFHEGLMLRSQMQRTFNTIYYTAYELIAYVSAIEACLETALLQKELLCPNCGESVEKEEWKISERFRFFIRDNSEDNSALIKIFKDLYNDRSMFVHTGINLHRLNSIRPQRPMILRGKKAESELPYYYYNIHELTGWLLRKYFYKQLFCALDDKDCKNT
jgi:hypothetical protein